MLNIGKLTLYLDSSSLEAYFQLYNSITLLDIKFDPIFIGVVVITTAQLHSNKSEFRFCAGSNPACDVLEIRDGEDL